MAAANDSFVFLYAVHFHESVYDIKELIRQSLSRVRDDILGYFPVKCMGNASCNTCHRVTVTAERYCLSYGFFEIFGFEEGYYGLRYGPLRRHIKAVSGPYIVETAVKVINEAFLYFSSL